MLQLPFYYKSRIQWVLAIHTLLYIFTRGNRAVTRRWNVLTNVQSVFFQGFKLWNGGRSGRSRNNARFRRFGSVYWLMCWFTSKYRVFLRFILTPGRMYDKHGNRRQWWTQETMKTFSEKAECFVQQYSDYSLTVLGNQVKVHTGVSVFNESPMNVDRLSCAWLSARTLILQSGNLRIIVTRPCLRLASMYGYTRVTTLRK